ncbi:nucleoside-diphosphate kinase [Staphylococcus kloosii]|uniref:nucleoside-diphosphate kinase n=1 Tax=Staphylococcus kloosii TaxID=29384 RepID=UPI0028A3FA37|nr:nucleoside-diphosphate kinase [Staphylococcus kloosii]MDT3959791.1 nucleoside-diphosphate kinase [Staphylococcus kloosii]
MREKTLIILKPDCLEKHIVNKVIERLLKVGQIINMDFCLVNSEKITQHYSDNLKKWPMDITYRVINYFVNKNVIILVLEGEDICRKVREIIGDSDPANACEDTIRGDFSEDSYELALAEKRSCYNIIHASDNYEQFKKEYTIWFGDEKL